MHGLALWIVDTGRATLLSGEQSSSTVYFSSVTRIA